MKHYVLGLIFNKSKNKILLVEKRKPEWMKGMWNGIGGKIEEGEKSIEAMIRETIEETTYNFTFTHTITFICPGGTVFVFKAFCTNANDQISYEQAENEELRIWPLYNLPVTMMANLKWIIPLSLSSVQLPVIVQQNELGVY